MKCKNCNAEISDDSKFCPACGKDPFNEAESNMGDIPNFVSEYSNMNSKFLIKGEKIIAKAKWSKIPFILFWVLYFLGLLIFQFSPFGYIFRYGMMWLLVLIWIISIAVCALSILLFVLRRELIITDKKIYGRMGLIGTKQYIIPLNKINYISVRFSIIGRLLNCATLLVYPGTFFGIKFGFMSNSKEIKNKLEELVYRI